MSYVKKVWSNGDVIDATSLNNIENGIKANANAIENIQNSTPIETSKIVDLVMFMGQSNMAGRGTASESPVVPVGCGYEFRAISDPTKLYDLTEPFGKNENNSTSGVTEGSKTGSMVSSFVNEYYKHTKTPIVAVSCSKGGTSIDFWQPNGKPLNDAISRHNLAKEWLLENGYTIRRDFMVWCQGETDGDNSMSKDTYISKAKLMIEAMMECGVERCFIVRIGNHRDKPTFYDTIINAQTELCKTYKNATLVSTDFAGMATSGLMKDVFHYKQEGYNIAGANAGRHTAYYINNGVEPCMYDVEYNNLYLPYDVELGGGSNVVLDTSLSGTSTNGVQNKVVTSAINNITNQVQTVINQITSLSSEVTETKSNLVDFESRLLALENGGGDVQTVNVTYNLTNVTSSNSTKKAILGRTFTTTLNAITGYEIDSVVVKMGGVNVTNACYDYPLVSIETITGDIEIIATAREIAGDGDLVGDFMLNLDFTKKSLANYVSDGLLSLSDSSITSTHTSEGDLLTMPQSSFVTLNKPITFPTNFEIQLRFKTTGASTLTSACGLPLFNKDNFRPMLNFRYGGAGVPSGGLFYQSRLLASGGDAVTISDLGVPVKDNAFHDVVIHYEGNKVWMSVDGEKSSTVTTARTSNEVNRIFGFPAGGGDYRWNNITLAYLRVCEL